MKIKPDSTWNNEKTVSNDPFPFFEEKLHTNRRKLAKNNLK